MLLTVVPSVADVKPTIMGIINTLNHCIAGFVGEISPYPTLVDVMTEK